MKITPIGCGIGLCLLIVSGSGCAAPVPLGSCSTITEPGSYVLETSLTATGDCFVIQASQVTLNLDGQSITGDGTGAAVTTSGVSRRAIVVRNGTISNFDVGVDLKPSENIAVKDLNIWKTSADGIQVGNHSTVIGNSITAAAGIGIQTSCCSVISNNSIEVSGTACIQDGGGQSVISNNTISGGSTSGILGGPSTIVVNNTILSLSSKGVSGSLMLIQGNIITGGTAGVEVTCPSNISDNTIYTRVSGGAAIVTSGTGCSQSGNATN